MMKLIIFLFLLFCVGCSDNGDVESSNIIKYQLSNNLAIPITVICYKTNNMVDTITVKSAEKTTLGKFGHSGSTGYLYETDSIAIETTPNNRTIFHYNKDPNFIDDTKSVYNKGLYIRDGKEGEYIYLYALSVTSIL